VEPHFIRCAPLLNRGFFPGQKFWIGVWNGLKADAKSFMHSADRCSMVSSHTVSLFWMTVR